MLGPLRTVRTQIVRHNLRRKKPLEHRLEDADMSAADALRAAHAAGVTVMLDGEGLLLEANAEPPQAVLDVLARHKLSILALLRSSQDGWTAEDWRARFDERAGFLEHDGGLLRVEAEVQAFERCIVEWLNRTPSSPSARGAAHGAAGPKRRAPWSCHSGRAGNATHGCTPNAGPLGINRDGPKPTWH